MNVRSVMIEMEELAEKKKAIFESTLDLIKEHGFHGTPMSLVAKSAGVAAGTIYHYFESKEQLVCELYAYNIKRVQDIIISAISAETTYKNKFSNIWMKLYKFYIKNPQVLIFFEQYLNSPYNKSKSLGLQGPLYEFFKEGVDGKELKAVKPEVIFLLLIGSVNSTAKLKTIRKLPLNDSDLQQIVEILWTGINND